MTPQQELKTRQALKAAIEAGDQQAELSARRALAAAQQQQQSPARGEIGGLTEFVQGADRGIASLLGLPVDAVAGPLNYVGQQLDIPALQSAAPVGGSAWMRQGLQNVFGVPAESSTMSGVAGEIVGPGVLGAFGMSRPLAASMSTPTRTVNPATIRNVELASTAGSAVGGAGAEYLYPGNPLAATAGSFMGGFAPAGVQGAARTGRNIAGAITPEGRAGRALQDLPPEATVRARLDELGEDAMLADIPEAQRTLEGVYTRPGRHVADIDEALAGRSAQQGEQLLSNLGPNVYREAAEQIGAAKSQIARPLYEAAYAEPLKRRPDFQRWWNKPIIQEMWKSSDMKRSAALVASTEDVPYNPAMFETEEPTVQGVDYLLRHLDRAIANAEPGDRIYLRRLRTEGRNTLKTAAPGLDKARSYYAGQIEAAELLEEGNKQFLRGSASDVEARLKELSPSQLEIYRKGAINALQDKIEAKGDTHDVTTIFRNQAARRRMRALFGPGREGERAYKLWEESVRNSQQKQMTYSRTIGNSATARRQQQNRREELMGVVLDELTPERVSRLIRGGRRLQGLVPGQGTTDEILTRALLAREYPNIPVPQRLPGSPVPRVAPALSFLQSQ